VRARRLPPDFTSIVSLVGDPGVNVQLIVCADERHAEAPLLAATATVQIPSLRGRLDDLPRIVDEYGSDAAAALGVDKLCFTVTDRQWVIHNGATSLPEIEKATTRLLALKTSANMSQAAERLGMAPVSLSRWAHRRTPPWLPPP
jgi:DNA-binding NtrC family response regulator